MGEAWNSLPVLDRIPDSVPYDFGLRLIAEMVLLSNPHGDGDLIDARKRDLLSLISNLIVLLELLEALFDGALSIVKRRLH